ncbi:hypothetical protein NDN08_006526 [Rhodosorus marinus]|uniref:Molybdopterin synthase catalytic subunit n=1 Tax=Rhodosorus marinus TaxID=101924 RepID=A0AAV8UHY7_9RHOD|nr:hypothetical protein NDN08_006526 [Rhodosorus marinus]
MSDDDVLKLSNALLSVDEAYQAVVTSSAGGISTFVGTTRDTFEGKTVVRLEYEAYEEMALKEMQKLCDKVRARWDIKKMAVFHRLGAVPVEEASVIIAVSSAHRREAIEACHFAIDELKARVPIWKKEIYEDGSNWKANGEFNVKTAS